MARLRAAAELAHSDVKAAVAQYDSLAADTSLGQTMRDLATVRAAILMVDTASFDEVRGRLEPLTATDRPFRHTAREMLAMSAWRAADAAATRKYIDMIVGDAETPPAIRQRVEVLSALLAAEGKDQDKGKG